MSLAVLPSLVALLAPVSVEAAAFPGLERPRAVGCAVLDGGLTLTSDAEGFGGFSGLALHGEEGIMVSDRGRRLTFRLLTDEDGVATGLAATDLAPLRDAGDAPLGGGAADIEEVVSLGTIYAVTGENENRVARLEGDRLTTSHPAAPADAGVLGRNSGFEAAALLRGGRLLLISEGTDADGLALVRRGQLGDPLAAWSLGRYRPAPNFNVTAARADPATGDLFVLERAFSIFRGPRMRLARVPAERLGDAVLAGRTLTRMGWREGIDNMEGLEVVRRADGTLRFYLVSDDNFSGAQRTVLLSLALAPGCEDGNPAQPPARGDAAP